MRIFYDTEFLDNGKTIDLISIGIVAEDGREYYAVNRNMPKRRIRKHEWLMANVVPGLPRAHGDERNHQIGWLFNPYDAVVKGRSQIADEVAEFILAKPDPQLWAYYAAYDHVCLAQLWGPMSDLPRGIPMQTDDIVTEAKRLGLGPNDLPVQPDGLHNALADARHNLVRARFLDECARAER
jgi:hypothetical protein